MEIAVVIIVVIITIASIAAATRDPFGSRADISDAAIQRIEQRAKDAASRIEAAVALSAARIAAARTGIAGLHSAPTHIGTVAASPFGLDVEDEQSAFEDRDEDTFAPCGESSIEVALGDFTSDPWQYCGYDYSKMPYSTF